MATETGSVTSGDRTILVVALAFLGATTGIVFGRVFLGTHPAIRLAAAGAIAVLIGAVLARRSLALSLLASGVGLLLVLGLLVYPDTTWAGLPSLDTVRAIVRSFRLVTDQAATEVAPAPPLAPLMTAAMMAVWSASTAAHALAVRSGSSVLPLLPGAALLAFSGVVTEDPPRPGYVLLFLAAAFAVLFAEATQRTFSWGSRSPTSGAIFSGRWARTLGTVAALGAIAIPGVLPGFGDRGLLDIGGPTRRVSVNPIVDIRPSLLQNPPANLFRVRADRPAYWRLVVLDRFDGQAWKLSEDHPVENGQPLSLGTQPLIGESPTSSLSLRQEVEIEQLGAAWLPAAADPVEISLEDDLGARHFDRMDTIELEADTSEGMRYQVTSAVARPSLSELDRIQPTNANSDPRYTALPAGLPSRIHDIAIELTAGAETPFDKVLAIQEYLRTFTYDEEAPAGHGTDAILNFLEESRRGFCEQFAGTMAVLVRSLGYPARVAIGFLPGDRQRDGWNEVTTAQVHAWPEVHFGEFGWLAFEPTPSRDNPTANYLVHLPSGPHPDANLGSSRRRRADPNAFLRTKDEFQGLPTVVRPPARGGQTGAEQQPFPWRRLLLVALMLAGIALLLIPPSKAIGRRLALSRARDTRSRVLAAYAFVLDGAADLGLGRRPGETPFEYQVRLKGSASIPDASLDRLTLAAGGALYSPREPATEQGEQAVDDARIIVRELRRKAGFVRSAVGAVRPGRLG
jgi:hypothetical protein